MRQIKEQTVWERVKEALKDAGLPPTQVYAAKIIGGEQGSISDWNKPRRGPSIDNAREIGKCTNTCVEWILTGAGPKHPGPPEEVAAKELWDLWGRVPELERGKILGMAIALAVEPPKRQKSASTDGLHPRPSR